MLPSIPLIRLGQLEPELKGHVLIEELNCAACHSGEASPGNRSKKAPGLAEIGSRVNLAYLEASIRDPHGIKRGSTMPSVMTQQSDEERTRTATAFTHFLLSQKENHFAPGAPDVVAAQQGNILFHSRGCAACRATWTIHCTAARFMRGWLAIT